MHRLVRNVVRLPRRTWQSFLDRRDPAYTLQGLAERELSRRLAPERLARLDAIPGTSSGREGRLLAFLALEAPPGGCFVEIGAFKGKTTAWLVEAAQLRADRPAVISIDPHLGDTWDAFNETATHFELYGRGLQVKRAFSHDAGLAWSRPIALLWIDGSHDYEDVCTDIDDFTPHVLPGGWVVFDDARGGHFPGAERAVHERMVGRPGFRHVGAVRHFELFQRQLGVKPD